MSFKTLLAYQKSFRLAMECFELSKGFPAEEKYDLTSQLRRSSRSVCAQIAEGYRKRKYPKYFVSKLVDASGENSETEIWIDFSFDCNYINEQTQKNLLEMNHEVGRLLSFMIDNPDKFGSIKE
ncbi:MAG: four helix bundle protein [Salibacteraceae bacterium]|jgi:four helix bundle protein|nr:four helix bundle protein [Salibacteraceae bacterium]